MRKIITINLAIFFILVVLIELSFGYWLDKDNFGYLMRKRYTITGSTLRPQEDKVKASYVRSLIKHVWPFLEKRQIVPIIQKCFGLSKVSFAHKALEKGDHVGKFVLKI